jgi:hypothetical protein
LDPQTAVSALTAPWWQANGTNASPEQMAAMLNGNFAQHYRDDINALMAAQKTSMIRPMSRYASDKLQPHASPPSLPATGDPKVADAILKVIMMGAQPTRAPK